MEREGMGIQQLLWENDAGLELQSKLVDSIENSEIG